MVMTIIIQAGHESSYSQELMDKLYQGGLNKPLASLNHQITAQLVSESLKKISDRPGILLDNNKLADNLAVDLLLSNLSQEEWGWNHPDNLFAMNYWAKLEQDSRFILVFDHPKYLLDGLTQKEITVSILDNLIENWINYHNKLLMTYESLGDNAILLEGQAATKSIGNSKTQIQSVNTILQLKSAWQLPIERIENGEENISRRILTEEIIKAYPEILIVYEKLLKKAKLKMTKSAVSDSQHNLSRLVAWYNEELTKQSQQTLALNYKNEEIQKQLEQLESQKVNFSKVEQENQLLLTQLHQVQEELEKYYLENKKQHTQLIENQKISDELIQKLKSTEHAQQKLEEIKKQIAEKDKQIANAQAQVSENQKKTNELTKKLQDNVQLNQQLMEAKKQIAQKDKQIADEKSIIQTLNTQLAQNKTAQTDTVQRENELLITQLHKVQEELEKYYLENQQLKKNTSINEHTEPTMSVYYGAVDRVKTDLPYRLGATMVSHSKSVKDLAVLPLALAKEYRTFQRDKPVDELPPLEAYQDASEAEKVKKHLSYRLGKTLVDGIKSPNKTFKLPIKLVEELIDFRK